MHGRDSSISKIQAISETNAGRGFIVWMAAWALLTLALFVFHGANTNTAGKVAHNQAAPGAVIANPDSTLPVFTGSIERGS